MNAPHPLAKYLHAYANGEKVQQRPNQSWPWARASLRDFSDAPNAEFRIAPETVLVNGVECPKPLAEPYDRENYVVGIEYGPGYPGPRTSCKLLGFNTKEDARAVFDALCLPFGDKT